MKYLTLTRFYTPAWGTFGELRHDDGLSLKTIEQPWQGNEPFNSCIPEGTYQVIRDSRPQNPKAFCLINEDLGIFRYPRKGFRDSILIHVGNTMYDVVGCIAPGTNFLRDCWNKDRGIEFPGVENSRKAFDILDHYIGDDQEFELFIYQYRPGKAQAHFTFVDY